MDIEVVVHIHNGILLSHKRNAFESVLMRWMKIEPIIQSEKVKVTQLCPTLRPHWTVESMEFSRPQYWRQLTFPSLGDLLDPGIEPRPSALQADS